MHASQSRLLFTLVGSCILAGISLFVFSQQVHAYYTDISASVVIGQQNFTSNSNNQGSSAALNTASASASVVVGGSQLFVADNGNNRILVFNSIPIANNASANFVIGQTTNTATSTGCAQNRLSMGEGQVLFVGGKLIIADSANNRVLIYNTIPSSSGINADVVIGQANFTTCTANRGSSVNGNTLSTPVGLASNGTNLIISDSGNNRVLIFATIPTAVNASATVVLGQSLATTSTANNGGISAHSLSGPLGVALNSDGRLVIADANNNRALNFNATPTSNNTNADSVLGQSTTTTNSFNAVSITAMQPTNVVFDSGGKLYVSDKTNSRVLVFGSVPAANNPSADIVIGQIDFLSNGTSLTADGLSSPKGMFVSGTQLFIADSGDNRVLIYNNVVSSPSITLAGSTIGQPDGSLLRMSGTATVDSKYFVKNVEYSVNYSTWTGAQASDGAFNDDSTEDFFFDFDPTVGLPLSAPVDDYTIRIRATNNNGDITSNAFYFNPFILNNPVGNLYVTTTLPTFDFSVSTQRQAMKENVSKYQVWVKKFTTDKWLLYVDNIPVDFASVKSNGDNMRASVYKNITTNNGVYENSTFIASYSAESSEIQITTKDSSKQLTSGTYQWKVVAFDNEGHQQETQDNTSVFRVNTHQTFANNTTFFPLTISYISGLGNVDLSSIHPDDIVDTYTTQDSSPTISGVAFTNTQVDLVVTEQNCTEVNPADCINTYNTFANAKSEWGINIPDGDLDFGKSYTFSLSATKGDNYVELPDFSLQVGGGSAGGNGQSMLLKQSIGTNLLSNTDASSAHFYPILKIKKIFTTSNLFTRSIFDNYIPTAQFSVKRFLASRRKATA